MKNAFALTLAALLAAGAAAHDTGPHKGPVAEWGDEEYHVEIVAGDGTVTAYVYGDHDALAKGTAKAIAAKSLTLTLAGTPPTVLKLEPRPTQGDPAGSAAVFVGKAAVAAGAKLAGSVSGKVGTKPYTGDFGK